MSTLHHPNGLPVAPSGDPSPGWRLQSVGETVRSSSQAYCFHPSVGWRLSSFYTREGQKVTGRTEYRVPASVGAWVSILPGLVSKLARGYWKLLKSRGKTMV